MFSLALPKTLEDLCNDRNHVLNLYQQIHTLLTNIVSTLDSINPFLAPTYKLRIPSLNEFRQEIDKRLWRLAFEKVDFYKYMDAKTKQKLEDELLTNTPEFTYNNVQETLLTLASQSHKMFIQGIVTVFQSLSQTHKTNTDQPFTINHKAILKNIFQTKYNGGLQVQRKYPPSRKKKRNLTINF